MWGGGGRGVMDGDGGEKNSRHGVEGGQLTACGSASRAVEHEARRVQRCRRGGPEATPRNNPLTLMWVAFLAAYRWSDIARCIPGRSENAVKVGSSGLV